MLREATMPGHDAATVVLLMVPLLLILVLIVVGWVLPICLGVGAAKRKNYSPHWMWFGIHPISGWIACIVLLCIRPQIQCPNCGGFVRVNFRICPYCHVELASPPSGTIGHV
jgi:hypothetical protein